MCKRSFPLILLLGCMQALISLPLHAQTLVVRRSAAGLYGYSLTAAQDNFAIPPRFQKAFPFMRSGYAKVVAENGQWGLIDEKGNFVLPPQYQYIGWSDDYYWMDYLQKGNVSDASLQQDSYNQLIGFVQNGLWGLVHIPSGKVVLSAQYDALRYPKGGLLAIGKRQGKDTLWGLRSLKNKEILPLQYHFLQSVEGGSYWIAGKRSAEGKLLFGALDFKGKFIWELSYEALRFEQGFWLVRKQNRWQAYKAETLDACFGKQPWDAIRIADATHAIVQKNGRWGVCDIQGKMLLPLQYRSIYAIHGNRYRLAPFPEWQFYDETGMRRAVLQLAEVQAVDKDLLIYTLDGRSGFLSPAGEMLSSPQYDYIRAVGGGICLVRDSSGCYALNRRLERLTPPADSVQLDFPGFLSVYRNGQWALYDSTKRQIIPFGNYESIRPFHFERFAVKQEGLWGIMDRLSRWIVSPRFDSLSAYTPPYWIAYRGQHQGLYAEDKQKWLIEPIADSLHLLSRYACLMKQGNSWYLVRLPEGSIQGKMDDWRPLNDTFLLVRYSGYEGILHRLGQWVIEPYYTQVSGLSKDGIFTIYHKGKYGLVNRHGEWLLPLRPFDALGLAQEGLVPMREGRSWGFVSIRGNKRISSRYGSVKPYAEGLAAVQIAGKWGFIDAWESLRIQPLYEEAESFEQGKAMVKYKGKWGVIDTQGKTIVGFEYDSIERLPKGWWLVSRNGKQGIVDAQGIERLHTNYEQVVLLNEAIVVVKQNGHWGLLRMDGFMLAAPVFEQYLYDPYSKLLVFRRELPWQTIDIDAD
ncbi:hypothetical protein FHS56_000045 [Thermonema lapsum]|uniref:WG repeat-containing protein n=1 Tax=Thermonema lapsum TaxID=28195 RepID=A0A846MM55_9BACT|nr:WG repeat-containing protein [Thermonema lapsum]NIK72559.1 hypothetical protein [Thermonema lapsum]